MTLSPAQQALLAERLRGRSSPAGGAPEQESVGPGPLAVVQEQLWFFDQLVPDAGVYNEAVRVLIDGPLDVAALREAVALLPARHEAWRSCFPVGDGTPSLQLLENMLLPLNIWPETGLAARDQAARDQAARDQAARGQAARELAGIEAAQARPRYDLATGPLVRATLVRVSEQRQVLLLALHHLVFDGTTLSRIVIPDLGALYLARAHGRAEPAAPGTGYAGFARRQQEWVLGPAFRRRLAWWRAELDGAPRLELPLDRPRPGLQSFDGTRVAVRIPAGRIEALATLASGGDATLFHALAAVFATTLSGLCGQRDIVFGTVADLRASSGLGDVAGYAVTAVPIRCRLGSGDFTDTLEVVRDAVLDAVDHVVPFERLVRGLELPRDVSTNPLFQAAIVVQPRAGELPPGWVLRQLPADTAPAQTRAKFDLHLELEELADGSYAGRLTVNAAVLDARTADRFAADFSGVLESALLKRSPTAEPEPEPGPAAGLRQDRDISTAERDLLDRVESMIATQPDAVAVTFRGARLSYGELGRRAAALAAVLGRKGAAPGAVVGLCLRRGPDLLVAMLAIAQTGAAYLPLDPEYPAERIAVMATEAGVRIAVAEPDLGHLLPDCLLVRVEGEPAAGAGAGAGAGAVVLAGAAGAVGAVSVVPPGGLLYVLFTSGSTGRPKGVMVSRAGVSMLLEAFAELLALRPGQAVLAHTTMAFDISVLELWLPLAYGATIVLADPDEARDGRALRALLAREPVEVLQATPATWQLLLAAGWAGQPGLSALCGGERLAPELAAELMPRVGRLWNCYGPTETTVWSTVAQVTDPAAISIGSPIAGTRVHVVDDRLVPRPAGTRGELLIGGAGVMAGYLGRPELDAERLVPEPGMPGAIAYRTGDLVRQAPDGTLHHLGRTDDQVKIRGFRIEPGEIESALLADTAVRAAVVLAREDRPGELRLVGYVVLLADVLSQPLESPGRNAAEAAVLAGIGGRLRLRLPAHLVPAALVALPEIPLTANGKVNRAALPAPELSSLPHEPPRPGLETQLAAVWQDVLGVEQVGRHDDFFDLGGHSLLAALLMVRLERATGHVLPLLAMLQGGSTLAGMSAMIGGPEPAPVVSRRGVLQIVYPSEESRLSLRHLLPLLPTAMVGLVLPRVDGRFDVSGSVEALAVAVLEKVRATQPEGPYLLAGYSFAGLVVYEMARMLHDAGESVAWLGLLDTLTPAETAASNTLSVRGRLARARDTGWRDVVNDAVMRTQFLPAPKLRFDWHGVEVLTARYSCTPHQLPLTVFTPTGVSAHGRSATGGWRGVHGGSLAIHPVSGDHSTMVQEPHVEALGHAMAASLELALPLVGRS